MVRWMKYRSKRNNEGSAFNQTLAKIMSKLITTRSVKWTVGAFDEAVDSEALTSVEIIDEGAGEFVQVSQADADGITMHINIRADEWPELLNAVTHAVRMCQEAKP